MGYVGEGLFYTRLTSTRLWYIDYIGGDSFFRFSVSKLPFGLVTLKSYLVLSYFKATRGDRREVARGAPPLLLFCRLGYMSSFSN